MTFNYIKYYKEIKNRLILLFLTWSHCLNICYYYKENILLIIIHSNIFFFETNNKPYFIYTNIAEIFYIYFEIIAFVSNQLAIVVLLYQIFMFFSLGLYHSEFTKLKLTFQIFVIAWVFCSITLLKIFVPFSWKFFVSFQENLINTQSIPLFFEAKLNEYLQYFIHLYNISLISCQFVIIVVLVLNKLNSKLKKRWRKLFYLIVMFFSTFITPPEILSQMIISFILILIYEFLIFIKETQISMADN